MAPVLRIGKSVPEIATGSWQLHWYGEIEGEAKAAKTPFVSAYFHRVFRDAARVLHHTNDRVRVRLPVTDTPAFQLGTIVSEGYVLSVEKLIPQSKWADISIDFTRENTQVFSRIPVWDDEQQVGVEGGYDFFLRRGVNTVLDDGKYNAHLIAVNGAEGDLPHIFSCWTIFQFFWAPTSKWAQLMVDGRFLDPDQYLINRERTRISKDGTKARLWLRQWMKDEDVPFLATIAFDDYAMEAGANIYRFLAQRDRGGTPRSIRALPPYQGNMRLKVLRHLVKTNAGEAWLVQTIESCGYQSEIKEILFDRDNDGRSLDDALDGIERKPMDRPRLFSKAAESILDLSHHPHRSSSAESEVEIRSASNRFPQLNQIHCKKLPQSDTRYASVADATARLALWEDEVSTLGDSSSASELAPLADIRAQRYQDEQEVEAARQVMGDMTAVAMTLLGANNSKIEVDGRALQVKIEVLYPGWPAGTYFLVPLEEGSSRNNAWRFIDIEKKQRKRGLCLRIAFEIEESREAVVRYLLDFEPRLGNQQNRMLLLWATDGWALDDEEFELSEIVAQIARNSSTVLERGLPKNIYSRNRNHTSLGAEALLHDIYLAVDHG